MEVTSAFIRHMHLKAEQDSLLPGEGRVRAVDRCGHACKRAGSVSWGHGCACNGRPAPGCRYPCGADPTVSKLCAANSNMQPNSSEGWHRGTVRSQEWRHLPDRFSQLHAACSLTSSSGTQLLLTLCGWHVHPSVSRGMLATLLCARAGTAQVGELVSGVPGQAERRSLEFQLHARPDAMLDPAPALQEAGHAVQGRCACLARKAWCEMHVCRLPCVTRSLV